MNPGTENVSEAEYKSRNESEGKEGRETEEIKTEPYPIWGQSVSLIPSPLNFAVSRGENS